MDQTVLKMRTIRLAVSLFLGIVFSLGLKAAEHGSVSAVLPPPNGCHSVGTTTIFLSDSHRHRDLLVTLWYPALDAKSAVAAYMDRKTADAVAEEWKLQPGFEQQVETHARVLAPFAEDGPFPVVLLEHGSGVVPAMYTILAEGLASSGFVVAATNHPPDSLVSVLPDGRVLKAAPYWPEDADRHTQGVAIGKFAEDVLVPDVRFVLDQLEDMNSHDQFWRGHLDLSRVGIVGHSMGGTTAALATAEERRIVAGVNLDGSTYPGMNGDVRPIELHKPLLFLATEEHSSGETHAREYAGSPAGTYYVVVAAMDHMSFTDTRWLQSRFSRAKQPDDAAYREAVLLAERTRALVEEFLGKYLRGNPAPELDTTIRVERK